ncbi:metaxin-2-like isoform X2 [Actinia tenebrosa]|uniref:Metaxin-2-like isoform X2 n=1 Tax=Actinia tenebrosa TaxID=6105 RepID=A0A6P8H712_ACTTE|nr:metaxin-2-like isoform X2 [Actinia tenebrosa]
MIFSSCVRAMVSGKEDEGGWPEFVELYQPDKSIVLLSDAAKCQSVEAFLRFCNLPVTRKYSKNAEFMSPNGEVPLLRAGNALPAGIQEILSYIQKKGMSSSELHLKSQEKAEMMAYISLVEKCFLPAELYMSWCNKEWAIRSRHKYGSPYPTPLNIILGYKKQMSVRNQLRAMNWHLKKEEEVIEEFKKGCQALAEKLGGRKYFIHDLPTELDAVVFGHLHTILMRYQPDDSLESVVKMHKNLVNFVARILKEYFR